jgi:Transposase, Mutator family
VCRSQRDTISRITEPVVADAEAWRRRPLECVYPIVYFDAMVKVREDRSVRSRTCYLGDRHDRRGRGDGAGDLEAAVGVVVRGNEHRRRPAGTLDVITAATLKAHRPPAARRGRLRHGESRVDSDSGCRRGRTTRARTADMA